MPVRKTSKGRTRQKQALEPEQPAVGVRPNTESENPLSANNGRSPGFEQIQHRAYELFLARGGVHGCDLVDWFAAEQELTAASAADNGHKG